MSRAVIVRPPAKITLRLRVGARRPDGLHDVHTLLQTISLTDTLTATGRKGPFALGVRSPGVPDDRRNLVWQAAEKLWRLAGRDGEPRDAHVRLDKSIPTQAGLGGGSADAAGALIALNTLWDLRVPRRQLRRVASELGSDVPFFLQGGTAVGVGRGDETYPVDDVQRLGVVVIKPSFGVATADAYRWLDEDRAAGIVDEAAGNRELDAGWASGPLRIVNDLEGPVSRRHAAIAEMTAACRREGAQVAAMTGSGSSVFGLFAESTAEKAARRLRRPDWLVMVGRTLSRREAARKMGV
jgi:4-diphosphocytidyl-2-C-methyl-D-erythritol kinase